MRDPKRINRILKEIEKAWNDYPDQRFGQTLINLGIAPDELWFWRMEDDELEKGLKEYNKKMSKKKK